MNIIYLHTHDLGRFCSPYGYGVETPNLQRLAAGGHLFKQAFCSAPTCSPSRASLLTGQYPHQCGMFGLTHQGWELYDYERHLAYFLGRQGYETALIGCHHVAIHSAEGVAKLPYERKIGIEEGAWEGNRWQNTDHAIAFLREPHDRPFFLSLGSDFNHHHRWAESCEHSRDEWGDPDPRYIRPLPNHPDCPPAREETAQFYRSIRVMDREVGRLLDALEKNGLMEETLIIFTTDHGPGLPGVKKTLSDLGTGVALILAGPGIQSGVVSDALVHHIDLYPTLCDLLGCEAPEWLEGRSLVPILQDPSASVREEVFLEQNYHGDFAPLRAVRTDRYKYIRRIGEAKPRSHYNADGGIIFDLWMAQGFGEQPCPDEALYDLLFDPNEANNLIDNPEHQEIATDLRTRLDTWMDVTLDPARRNDIPRFPLKQLSDSECFQNRRGICS